MSNNQDSNLSIFSDFLKPILIVLFIPIISYLFFTYANYNYDSYFKEQFIAGLNADYTQNNLNKNTNEYKEDLEEIQKTNISEILRRGSSKSKDIIKDISSSTVNDYKYFNIANQLAAGSILLILATIVFVLIIAFLTMKSQTSHFRGFKFSFNLLKIICTIQVIAQGVLLVALSFYVTVVLWNSYFPKIIGLLALLVVITLYNVILAIFKRPDTTSYLNGTLIDKKKAPELWNRITEICQRFQIPTPDNFIVGIDDNFFATENKIVINNETISGKSLYGGIPLLKILSKQETDAILAHEMAHFSGKDTTYTKKLSPELHKFSFYIEALGNGISPVFFFMVFFWNIFQITINKISREREFRADLKSAEFTSPKATAYSLLKVSAYSSLRNHIESDFFSKNHTLKEINISEAINSSFKSYINSNKLNQDLEQFNTPHPFDTHPTLSFRFKNLGVTINNDDVKKIVLQEPSETYFESIEGLTDIEMKLWSEYETYFQKNHEIELSYRLNPRTIEEKELVRRHFPNKEFVSEKNKLTFNISYEKISLSDWDEEIFFNDIKDVQAEDELFKGKVLTFKYLSKHTNKKAKAKLRLKHFPKDDILGTFEAYYNRHLAMMEFAKIPKE